jgi:hypothetical protein
VVFNESEVLRAFDPAAGCITNFTAATVKLWYNDEHALTLGVRRVDVIERHCLTAPFQLCISNTVCAANATAPKTCGAAVTTTTNYPVSPQVLNPDHAMNPDTGSNILTGDQAGTDTNLCTGDPDCGRPMWPVLFVTDISVGDPNPRSGDWQYHGRANNPADVFGTWKGAMKTIDRTVSPATTTVTPDADPAKNNWNLGVCGTGPTSCDTAPAGLTNQGYGAEVRWNVSSLVDKSGAGLIPGHTYRFEFMVHDGDQNKSGGDSGEACVNAQFRF